MYVSFIEIFFIFGKRRYRGGDAAAWAARMRGGLAGRAPPLHLHAPRSEHKFGMVHAIIVVKFLFLMCPQLGGAAAAAATADSWRRCGLPATGWLASSASETNH